MFIRHASTLALALTATLAGAGCSGTTDDEVDTGAGAASSASLVARSYEGTIGSLRVMIRVKEDAGNVHGSYFYVDKTSNGDALVLEGKVVGDKLTMTETVNGAGAVTGTFTGTITSAGINGSWKAGSRTLPLALTAIQPGDIKTVIRKIARVGKPTEDSFGRTCALYVDALQVFGLPNERAERALDELLAYEPLDATTDGKCSSSDTRHIDQSVTLNEQGFLTVKVFTELSGGANISATNEYINVRLSDGARLGASDFFVDGANDAMKALLVKQINQDPEIDDEFKADAAETLEERWGPDTLEHVALGLNSNGMTVDMLGSYPRVIAALAPIYDIPWADLAPLLRPDSPIAALVK